MYVSLSNSSYSLHVFLFLNQVEVTGCVQITEERDKDRHLSDCIDKVGKTKYVIKFDLLKGFWQVPLIERAKKILTFVTPEWLC